MRVSAIHHPRAYGMHFVSAKELENETARPFSLKDRSIAQVAIDAYLNDYLNPESVLDSALPDELRDVTTGKHGGLEFSQSRGRV